ncbi:MAG: DNA polymerase I, partial [Elusimicrobia bacterium]|nr:DNA polymerase I [Candidatus Obscuribacterium magneticum]
MKKMCLIDASGYIHRAYHALPPLTNSRGQTVNAVFGFARMIQKLLKAENPDYLGVCFDTAAPTFRHQAFVEYKANREDHDETLISQFPLVNELTELWGLPSVRMDGFEADDVIATLAMEGQKAGCRVLILSGDKDTMQLVTEGVVVRDEIRRVDFDEAKVLEKFGIKPNQLVDYLSLMGDKVDNLSGVPGVGEKTAQKLLAEFGSLDALYADEQKMPEKLKGKLIQYKEQVFKNRELIALKKDVPLTQTLNDLIPQPPKEELGPFLRRLEFKDNFMGDSESAESRPDLKKNETRKVEVVLDAAALTQLAGALQKKSSFSYDLETDGLNVKKCRIVGLSISYQPDLTYYIPLGHHYLGVPQQPAWEEISRALVPLFLDEQIQKAGHNLKFDNAILNRHGIEINGPQFDTMVAAYCLEPSKNSFGLKNLVADEFGEQMTTYAELMKTTKAEDFTHIEIDTAAQYAGADAETTFRLKLLYEDRLKEKKLTALFYDLEMPLVEVIQAMERAGILIDIAHLKRTQQKFGA